MEKIAKNGICAHILLCFITTLLMFTSAYFCDNILNFLIIITLFGYYIYGWLIIDTQYKETEIKK